MIALKSNPDKAPKTDYYKNDKSSKQRLLSSGNVNQDVNFVNLIKKKCLKSQIIKLKKVNFWVFPLKVDKVLKQIIV